MMKGELGRCFCYCSDCNILVREQDEFTIEFTDRHGELTIISLCPPCMRKRVSKDGIYEAETETEGE